MAEVRSITPGRYRHWKGGLYDVLHNARLAEDNERPVVVYRSVADGTIWVRFTDYFGEPCGPDKTPRFTRLGPTPLGC